MLQGQHITSSTVKVNKTQTIYKHVTPIFAVSSKNWEEIWPTDKLLELDKTVNNVFSMLSIRHQLFWKNQLK